MTDTRTLTPSETILASRRNFLKRAGPGSAAAAGSLLAAPAIVTAQAQIRWRLQTCSRAPLGAR